VADNLDMAPVEKLEAAAWLARRFGPQFVLPTVNALACGDNARDDVRPDAMAGGLPVAERAHPGISAAISNAAPCGLGGSALRAAVLGADAMQPIALARH